MFIMYITSHHDVHYKHLYNVHHTHTHTNKHTTMTFKTSVKW